MSNSSKITSQIIYKNGCWGCKRALEDPNKKYVCPQASQHLTEYQKPNNIFKNYAKK